MAKKEEVKPLEGVELLLDRVIIEAIKVKDEVTTTGFTVPADARAKTVNLPKYGYVVACGPGDPAKGDMKVKVGDMVCYIFYSGTPLSMGDREFLIMREVDIVMIIKK